MSSPYHSNGTHMSAKLKEDQPKKRTRSGRHSRKGPLKQRPLSLRNSTQRNGSRSLNDSRSTNSPSTSLTIRASLDRSSLERIHTFSLKNSFAASPTPGESLKNLKGSEMSSPAFGSHHKTQSNSITRKTSTLIGDEKQKTF